MKTNQKHDAASSNARVIALASATGIALCVAQAALSQTAVEAGAVAKSTTAAAARPPGGPMQMTISMNSQPPAPAAESRGPNCTGAVRNESSVVVAVGKSTLVPLPEPVRNRTLGNPGVVQATMVSPQSMYVLGRSIGTTNMIVQGRSGSCSIINVVVNADSGGLQTSLGQLLPGERNIRVGTAADNLVLSGSVTNAQAAAQAMDIARAYANAAQGDKGGGGGGGGGGGSGGGVLNMMSVDTPQQVMLEVKVAEVSKTLLNQLGTQLNIQGGFGSWSGGLLTSFLTGSAAAFFANKANNKPFQTAIDAQKNDSLVKVLAEPNLVTLSGQEASFLAGGKIYIPVAQSNILGGAATITLQEEEFGVGLKFTPTVLSGGRINLKVSPEVSELSPTGATVSGSNLTGQTILPLITTRRASTTVQMRDGESFAIGGLLQDNARGTIKAVPGAGEIPVLGALFRSTSYQQDLSELVFVITPHLVQPLQSASYPLPTDSFTKPNELDVYFMGNMEGRKSAPANPAPAPAPAPAPQAPMQMPPAAPAAPSSQAPAPLPPAANVVPTATQVARAEAAPAPADQAADGAANAAAVPSAAPAADVQGKPLDNPAPQAQAAPPADDTAARIARIEATAERLDKARTRAGARQVQ